MADTAREERKTHVKEAIGLCHMAGSRLPPFMDDLFSKYVDGIPIRQLEKEFEERFTAQYGDNEHSNSLP